MAVPNAAESSSAVENALNGLAGRIRQALFLKFAVAALAVWGFAWGTGVLAFRALRLHAALGTTLGLTAASALIAVGVAVWLARKHQPSTDRLRAVLDRTSAAGGVVMAAGEASVGNWITGSMKLNVPEVTWRNGRQTSALAVALAFLIAGFFVPLPAPGQLGTPRLDVENEVDKLVSQVETLKDEKILDTSAADKLAEDLKQLKQNSDAQDPAKTLEAIDHADDAVKEAAKQASEGNVQKSEKLARTQELAEALADGNTNLDPKQQTEAMQALDAMMSANMKENQKLASQISEDLKEGLKSGKLSKEQLKQLASALEKHKGDIDKQMQKLQKGGMIDPKSVAQNQKAGQCNSKGLSEYLNEHRKEGQGESTQEAIGKWGKGGVSRGPGAAPMSFGEESTANGAKFKEQTLPSNTRPNLEDSQTVGTSKGSPTTGGPNGSSSGALGTAARGNGSAVTQTVLPRHRGTVRKYFERPANQ
jgi:hypothetical protein